jgi:hypothetical protein
MGAKRAVMKKRTVTHIQVKIVRKLKEEIKPRIVNIC